VIDCRGAGREAAYGAVAGGTCLAATLA
jgi:hypothetical protein